MAEKGLHHGRWSAHGTRSHHRLLVRDRPCHGGRSLNVSSMGGRATLPGGAFYHASKYAVEAFSDALRMEVAQFGIEVVLIEPGPVQTPWNDVAAGSLGDAASESDADPYAAY